MISQVDDADDEDSEVVNDHFPSRGFNTLGFQPQPLRPSAARHKEIRVVPKLMKTFSLFVAVSMLVAVGACHKEGPAERAGEKVDKAMSKAGDKLEEAGDKVKDSVDR